MFNKTFTKIKSYSYTVSTMSVRCFTLCFTQGEREMKKALRLSAILLIIIFILVSCNQNPVVSEQITSLSAKIIGQLDLPASGSVSGSDVWIKVVCDGETKYIGLANRDGSFSVSGLREDKNYDILFSTIKPETSNERSISRAVTGTTGYGGWLSNVTAAVNEGNNVGSVSIKPLGTIKGRAKLDGEIEHYDILVYIPGSSFSAFTQADGTFYLYNVPEGTYQLRFSYLKTGFGSEMSDAVTVRGSKTDAEEHPVVELDDKTLFRNMGIIEGKIFLDTEEDPTGISVMIKKDDGTLTFSSSTDGTGSYIINNVKPGTYTLYASRPGFDSIVIENIEVVPASIKKIKDQVLSSGVRYIAGKVHFELRNDHSGALITATNLNDISLVYSAISNTNGDFSLVSMVPGRYRIDVSANNYNTTSLAEVNVLADTIVELDVAEIKLLRGSITGVATLEGWSHSDGIKAELLKGTDVFDEAYTDETGVYVFEVPQGNYSGVRLSCDGFKTVTIPQSIALIANNFVTIGEHDSSVELKATRVSLAGFVTVKNAGSFENVTVRVENEPSFNPIVTDSTGYFRFDSLKVGESYSLRFSREFCADVVVNIDAVASELIEMKKVTMLPDSAGVEGYIFLEGISNHSGIKVEVESPDGIIRAVTDMNGYFYLGGLSANANHELIISKAGWKTVSTTIGNLTPLSVSKIDSITLVDEIAPVITKVSINGGANATGSRNVNVRITVNEMGSGAKYYRYYWEGETPSAWLPYTATFSTVIPNDYNGNYKLYVDLKDVAGNTSSESAFASIDLIGNVKTVSGRLSGDDLHWKAENNPIVVSGNIIISSGDELIIDPGVDVLFTGFFSIDVQDGGFLTAVGTADKPIVFRASRDYMSEEYTIDGYSSYDGNWSHISVNNSALLHEGIGANTSLVSGSRLTYCDIQDFEDGICGYAFITDSTIKSTRFAIGNIYDDNGTRYNNFYGCLLNNEIVGSVLVSGRDLKNEIFGNRFRGTIVQLPSNAYVDDYGNYYYWDDSNGYSSGYVNGQFWVMGDVMNNYISEYSRVLVYDSFEHNTIESCKTVTLQCDSHSLFNEFVDIGSTIRTRGPINYSNFVGRIGDYVFGSDSEYLCATDLTYNYWGDYTLELLSYDPDSVGDVSFIYDGYDDSKLPLINLNHYSCDRFEGSGFQGEGFLDFKYPNQIEEAEVGHDLTVPISSMSTSEIEYYRVSQDYYDIFSKSWVLFDGSEIRIPLSDVKPDKVSDDGYLYFYVQVRTGDTESSVRLVKIPFGNPVVTGLDLKKGRVFSNDNIVTYSFGLYDAGNVYTLQSAKVYIDDVLLNEVSTYFYGGQSFTINPTLYKNGEHILEIRLVDKAGKEGIHSVSFIIDRPIPTVKEVTINENNTIRENENLYLSLSVIHSKSLKEIRVLTDNLVTYSETVTNNNSANIEKTIVIDRIYLNSGTHKILIELEDSVGNVSRSSEYEYTVEGGQAPTPPTVSGFDIKNGEVFDGSGRIYLRLTASDDSGVRGIRVLLGDKILLNVDTPYYMDSLRSRIFVVDQKAIDFKNGDYDLVVSTFDFAGNTTTETKRITINKALPNLFIYADEDLSGLQLSYEIENRNYIDKIELLLDGVVVDSTTWNYGSGHNSSYSASLFFDDGVFPSGIHSFKYVAITHAGDLIESEELNLELTSDREPYDGHYGVGKTWNYDGSLIADNGTRFLWGFNDPVSFGLESVAAKRSADVIELTPGIGQSGARASVSTQGKSFFPDGSYTIEFWYLYDSDQYGGGDFDLIISPDVRFWVGYNIHMYAGDTNLSAEVMTSGGDKDWHYIAIAGDSLGTTVYVDGNEAIRSSYVLSSCFAEIYTSKQIRVDEFRISDVARSSAEINQYYRYAKNNNFVKNGDVFDIDMGIAIEDISSFTSEQILDNTYHLSGTVELRAVANNGTPVLYAYSCEPDDFRYDVDNLNWIAMPSDGLISLDASALTSPVVFFQFLDSYGGRSLVKSVNLSFVVGQRGPSGGYVFYDCDADNETGNADGLISSECGWRFLEAASEDHNFNYILFGYYRTEKNGENLFVNGTTVYNADNCTRTAIGTGESNTKLIVNAMGEETYSGASGVGQERNYAAKLCADLEFEVDGVVFDDWFLPSKDELNLMWSVLYEAGVGDFTEWEYWSSSEYPGDAKQGWEQNFPTGEQWWTSGGRGDYDYVRPIRSF